MTEIFFQYVGFGNQDPALRWLCANMKDKFHVGATGVDIDERHGNYLIFHEEEDMQLFILMWGEFV